MALLLLGDIVVARLGVDVEDQQPDINPSVMPYLSTWVVVQ